MKINYDALSDAITDRLTKGNDLTIFIDGQPVTISFSDKPEPETFRKIRGILLSTQEENLS